MPTTDELQAEFDSVAARVAKIEGILGIAPIPAPTPIPTPTPVPVSPTLVFAPTSPWNSGIPSTATVDPNSDNYIKNIFDSVTLAKFGPSISGGWNGTTSYPGGCDPGGIAIYQATSTTPKVPVLVTPGYSGWWNGFAAVPIPPGAKTSNFPDDHMVVVDKPGGVSYEFWHMSRDSLGRWQAAMGISFLLNGPGYQNVKGANGARAYGGSLLAGAIRYDELVAAIKARGPLPHGLGFSYGVYSGVGPLQTRFAMGPAGPDECICMATHPNGTGTARVDATRNLPLGAWIRMKPTVNVASVAPTVTGLVIGLTLQQKGAVCVDGGGQSMVFYAAQALLGETPAWTGSLLHKHNDTNWIKLGMLEVMRLPALSS